MFRILIQRITKGMSYFNIYNQYTKITPSLLKILHYKQLILKSNVTNKRWNFYYPVLFNLNLLTYLGLKKDESLDPESELIMTMKRAVLLTQRGEYNKAERMLHISLRMAQNQNNQKGITYIYDLMANLALDRGEFNKSKLLFINVMQRLFEEGVKEDDIKVIHISLKLARLSQYMSEFETAETGYCWCLEKLKNSYENDANALLLYGITCDWYGQFLLRTDRAKDAVIYFKRAYETCIKSKGVDTEQAIMLMNDIGTAEWYAGNLDEADKYLRIALKQSNTLSDKNITTVIKVNLGMVCLERGLMDDAQINCKEAWRLAKECENENALKQANHCIDKLKNFNQL